MKTLKIKVIVLILFLNFHSMSQQFEVDPSFQIGTGFSNGNIHKIAEYSDGKLLIAGSFTTYDTQDSKRIIRLNSDGSVDNSFQTGFGFDNTIRDFELLDNGKIILVGDFSQYNGSPAKNIVKLNSDGTVDTSFDVPLNIDNRINCVAIQSDGKILIGGRFTEFNSTQINRIARLNSNGTIDATFNVSTGANAEVNDIVILQSDKILVGGQFVNLAGNVATRVARLNTDGTLDATFNSSTGANSTVNTLEVQTDNKILVGGFFSSYSGLQIGNLVRLNENGTLDNSFNIGSGANNGVLDVVVQNDSKIIICGTFENFNGIDLKYFCKLNFDGSFDTEFNNSFNLAANNSIYSLLIQQDNKIMFGGLFTEFNSLSQKRIIRLQEKQSNSSIELISDSKFAFYFNLEDKYFTIQTNVSNFDTKIFNSNGQEILAEKDSKLIDLNKFNAGLYFVIIKHNDEQITKKILIF